MGSGLGLAPGVKYPPPPTTQGWAGVRASSRSQGMPPLPPPRYKAIMPTTTSITTTQIGHMSGHNKALWESPPKVVWVGKAQFGPLQCLSNGNNNNTCHTKHQVGLRSPAWLTTIGMASPTPPKVLRLACSRPPSLCSPPQNTHLPNNNNNVNVTCHSPPGLPGLNAWAPPVPLKPVVVTVTWGHTLVWAGKSTHLTQVWVVWHNNNCQE